MFTSPVVVFVVFLLFFYPVPPPVFLLLFCYIRRNLSTDRRLFLRSHLLFFKKSTLKYPIFSLAIVCQIAPLKQIWVFTTIIKAQFSYSVQVLTEENLWSNKYGVLNISLLLKKFLHLERYAFSASFSQKFTRKRKIHFIFFPIPLSPPLSF